MELKKIFGISENKDLVDITNGIGKEEFFKNNAKKINGEENIDNIAIARAGSMETKSDGTRNVAVGNWTLYGNTGNSNTAIGNTALKNNGTGNYNTAVGSSAMFSNTTGSSNTAIGNTSLNLNTTGSSNTAIGYSTLNKNTIGKENTAIGYFTEYYNTVGCGNVAIGENALCNNTMTDYNTAVGRRALQKLKATGNSLGANTAIGGHALLNTENTYHSTAVGYESLSNVTTGRDNTAIGSQTGVSVVDYNNTVCIGKSADVTGSNQAQIGTTGVTTYTYGAVQNRSDERDKTEIKDTDLGLTFVNALRPVKFKWNYREKYITINEDGTTEELENDGSKAGKRFHEGLIAQEVKAIMDKMGVDFAGYQDHAINGGKDVLSIGYAELITPLIKAIQELSIEQEKLKNELHTRKFLQIKRMGKNKTEHNHGKDR